MRAKVFKTSVLTQDMPDNSCWIIVSMGKLGNFSSFKSKNQPKKVWGSNWIVFLSKIWLLRIEDSWMLGIFLFWGFFCTEIFTNVWLPCWPSEWGGVNFLFCSLWHAMVFGPEAHRILSSSAFLPTPAGPGHSITRDRKTGARFHIRLAAGHIMCRDLDGAQLFS